MYWLLALPTVATGLLLLNLLRIQKEQEKDKRRAKVPIPIRKDERGYRQ